MNDMRAVIVPKSDQLNADDLLIGPITITIRDVTIRPGTEQPVSIFYEGDEGKPYKCCKSMARVMVKCWGEDANKYIGRSLTLYCDPKVKWGGMEVGGIRISHMSHINRDMVMALTVTKGNKKPFTVKPLIIKSEAENSSDAVMEPDELSAQVDTMVTLLSRKDSKTLHEFTAQAKYTAFTARLSQSKRDDLLSRVRDAVTEAAMRELP